MKIIAFLLVVLTMVTLSYADTDGVWHEAEDVRGGTFGLDEQGNTTQYTFINPVTLDSTLNVNDASTFTAPVDINSTLDVSGASTLSSTLNVGGTTTITGTANILSSTSIGGQLTANGLATFGNLVVMDNNANANNILEIDSGATTASYSAIELSDRENVIWGFGKDNSNNFYIDRDGVANRFIILDSTGYTGIGTLSPQAKLEVTNSGGAGFGGTNGNIRVTNSNDPSIQFVNTGSSRSVNLFLPSGSSELYIGGGSLGNNLYKIWTEGNDGSGSGLDADTIDGIDGVDIGNGLITSLDLGSGLTGNINSGELTLNVDTSYLQRRVATSCPSGSSIRQINVDGSVVCENDDVGDTPTDVGTIDGVTAGFGLTGGGTEGIVTLNVDNAIIQERVDSVCPANQFMTGINADGTVQCEVDNRGFNVNNGFRGYIPMYTGLACSDGSCINGANPSSLFHDWSTNYVGVDTTDPTVMLDVNGQIRMRAQTTDSDNPDIVSTKGYVDDTEAGIRTDMASIDGRVSSIEGQIDGIHENIDKLGSNDNGRWEGPITDVHYTGDYTYSFAPDEYMCGIRYRNNCDFTSSPDGCIYLKVCSLGDTYRCSYSHTDTAGAPPEYTTGPPEGLSVCSGGVNIANSACTAGSSASCYYTVSQNEPKIGINFIEYHTCSCQ